MATQNKQQLIQKENDNMVQLLDQTGVETAVEKMILKNSALIPSQELAEKIKNSAGFYITQRDDLMKLDKTAKLQMLYNVIKEGMVGCEAGTDYDIVPFKGKPVTVRKKEGWYKVINMIKPAEIKRFKSGVIYKGDTYTWNPVKEELSIQGVQHYSEKYNDIEGAYCSITFANGFEKTIFMHKTQIDNIKKTSPSGSSAYSPWNTFPTKMVTTKVVKEMAKELFYLFSGRLNSAQIQAINSDENSVESIDNKGNIRNDHVIYSQDYDSEVIEQDEEPEESEKQIVEEAEIVFPADEEQVNLNEL